MRTRPAFRLVHTQCRRCGRALMTGNRSLIGADALKAELGSICGGCLTPEEEQRILFGQAEAILGRPILDRPALDP